MSQAKGNASAQVKPAHQYSGIVRAANSGDSLSIFEQTKPDAPPSIREINFSNLQAPRLGHGDTPDKPWAWESREFLRKLAVGKNVKFTVENKQQSQNREYGNVILADSGVSIAEVIAEAGWAEVRPPPEGKTPRTELHSNLLALQTKAKEQKIGIFQEDESKGIRPVPKKLTTMEIYEKFKGQKLNAIVDYVRDANYISVILTDTGYKFFVKLAGAEAPSVPSKARQNAGEISPPFAEESRHFVERHLLQRDIQVTITAPGEAGRQGEYYGTIFFAGRSLAEQLIRNGFAKFVEWSAPRDQVEQFKQLQQQAQQQKLRIWRNFSPAKSSQDSASGNKSIQDVWQGKVREVRDGQLLIIEHLDDHSVHQVLLSNVKVPRLLRQSEKPQPYAYEARETLRTRALGKKVQVKWDYTRNEKDHFSVYLDSKTSLALLLVEKGYAQVVSFENCGRTDVYQQLTIAENRARAKSKHIWNKQSEGPVHRVTDTTLRSTETERKQAKRQAKQLFPLLERVGRIQGIVEHVFNGSRFKIALPKESCVIGFALEAIRTPSNRPEDNDPLGKVSTEFVYDKLFQRDVEVVVNSIDKGGNFIGVLYFNHQNFALTLLENGLAKINTSVIDYVTGAADYKKAEQTARNSRVRIWEKYDPEAEKAAAESAQLAKESAVNAPVKVYNVSVSEIVDAGKFFVQLLEQKPLLDGLMAELNQENHPVRPGFNPERGSLAVAKFSGDNQWYRVRVLKIENKTQATVSYIDYGNTDSIPVSELRPLDEKFGLKRLVFQAKEARLAFLDIPTGTGYGEDAAEYFHSLVWDKSLLASIEYTEGDVSHIRVGDGQQLVNVAMVEAGYATVSKSARPKESTATLIQLLKEKQEEARTSRRGVWEYGDFFGEDD